MENLQKKPVKGILRKNSGSGQGDLNVGKTSIEPIKWDEMNILQTLHPPDKDYGLMKIEEPPTPYNHYNDAVDGEPRSDDEEAASSTATLDLEAICEKVKSKPKVLASESFEDDEDDEEEYENLTEEEKKKRKEFEIKRKMHYNEFQAVKLARKLLEEDDEDDEGGDKKGDNKDGAIEGNDNNEEESMASDREDEKPNEGGDNNDDNSEVQPAADD